MPLTDTGRNHIADAIIADGPPTAFNNANAFIGVGNSATAFSKTDTDLIGASKFRQAMEATFPNLATNVMQFRSLMATGDANFAWAEWGVFNAGAAGTMLSRKVEALGTKTSAQSWQITVDLTVGNP